MLEGALYRVPKIPRASQDKASYPYACPSSFKNCIFVDLLGVYKQVLVWRLADMLWELVSSLTCRFPRPTSDHSGLAASAGAGESIEVMQVLTSSVDEFTVKWVIRQWGLGGPVTDMPLKVMTQPFSVCTSQPPKSEQLSSATPLYQEALSYCGPRNIEAVPLRSEVSDALSPNNTSPAGPDVAQREKALVAQA